MERRRLDNLDMDISLLGFGCMRFPTLEDGTIDKEAAQKMIDHAYESGITYYDTAYVYHDGKSEAFVGEALKKYPRDSYTLTTKLSIWLVKSLDEAKKMFAEQLEILQTDYVDFYLLHALNKERWDFILREGILDFVEEMRAAGKIKYIGFSFHDKYETFDEIIRYRKWDICQIQLNYMDEKEQAGLKGYKLAEELGIPVAIMEPIRGGALANFSDEINNKFYALDKDKSIASYSMRYFADLPNAKVILSGMSTMEQLQDNIETFSKFTQFNDAERKVVNEVRDILFARIQNNCTGCNYCMPCPHNVNIPLNFKLWNMYHVFEATNLWDLSRARIAKTDSSSCVGCGVCVSQCPQNIDIPGNLARVTTDLSKVESVSVS